MITNQQLKTHTECAMRMQAQGLFVVDLRNELPLPRDESLRRIRYSSQRDGNGGFYDYETTWGTFKRDPSDSMLLSLQKGNPPDELLHQPKLDIATATLHVGYVAIHNNGSIFELDLKTPDNLTWSTLSQINQTLQAEAIPLVVWQLDEAKEDKAPVIRVMNESAMVFASSAIWSLEEQQLVAAQVVSTSPELLKAIKATLANNNTKSYLSVKTPEDSAYLKGARKGYIAVANALTQANADGTVTALLHPLSGDPQANSAEFFYLVVSPEEEIQQKFIERLDLAIPWPLQKDWAEYLLKVGKSADLVQELPKSGSDFSTGLRIVKNESHWQQVIAAGLKTHQIQIA